MNEAASRIKINKLLEAAGWHFFAEGGKPAKLISSAASGQVTVPASRIVGNSSGNP